MPSLKFKLAGVALAALLLPAAAAAQSLAPMEKAGNTPSDRKAFRVQVGNPYEQRMTFVLAALLPDYATPTTGVVIQPERLTLAPGYSRQVIVTFEIDPALRERTIALCVMPEDIDGPILPRVCGRYTGRMAGRGG